MTEQDKVKSSQEYLHTDNQSINDYWAKVHPTIILYLVLLERISRTPQPLSQEGFSFILQNIQDAAASSDRISMASYATKHHTKPMDEDYFIPLWGINQGIDTFLVCHTMHTSPPA
jgi:hypothetical protein